MTIKVIKIHKLNKDKCICIKIIKKIWQVAELQNLNLRLYCSTTCVNIKKFQVKIPKRLKNKNGPRTKL